LGGLMGKENNFGVLLWCSIITSVLLLSISLFRWTLVDILTPFLQPLLELVVWGSAILVLICALIYMVMNIKRIKLLAAIPMLISLSVVLIAFFVPFTKLVIEYDFRSNLQERTAIVEQIQSGQLKPNISYNARLIMLPPKYRHLSKGGGEVEYETYGSKTIGVFFFTFRGILDNFSGFIYRSDDNNPSPTDFGGDFIEITKLRDHWFWAASR
jgi:hypothetical protein